MGIASGGCIAELLVWTFHNFTWKTYNTISESAIRTYKCARVLHLDVTHMLPKKGDLKDPKNYRPITCLPSIYKILSGVHTKYVSNYIVNKQARNKLRNVSIAWIYYKRNYDSVPHTRLIKVMDMHDIAPQIINLIRFLVNTYRITLLMKTIKGIIRSGCINIKRGIF